jgi:hypothetical protein
MRVMTHDEVRALQKGDRLYLVYTVSGRSKFEGDVVVDDVTDMDICCKTSEGTYVSIMLQNPNGNGGAWPLDHAPGTIGGRFAFYHPAD